MPLRVSCLFPFLLFYQQGRLLGYYRYHGMAFTAMDKEKKLFLNFVFQPQSQFQGRKETITTMSTIADKTGEARGNASNDYREEHRTLYM